MPLAGPRLDRPSAIGDEGRPRATSLTIASLTVVGLFVVAGVLLGSATLVVAVGVLVGLVTTGMALQRRTRLVDQFVGHLCLLGAGSVLTFVSIALLRSGPGLLIVGLTLAMLALSLTWANVATAAGFMGALHATVRAFVALVGWFVAAVVVLFTGVFVWALLTEPVLRREPAVAVLTFGLALAAAGAAVHVALDHLPIVQLSPRSRRSSVRRRLRHARGMASGVAKAGVGFLMAVLGLTVVFAMITDARGVPLGDSVAALFGSPFVLGLPVVVSVLAVGAAAVAVGIRTVTKRMGSPRADTIPAAAAGLTFLVVLPVAIAGLPEGLLDDPGNVVVLLLLGPLALIFAFVLVIAGMDSNLVPDRAGGPAMAAGSLVLATIGAGVLEFPTPFVLASAAGALVVWDVSTFGLGVTAELGHRPETRRLELFHGVLAVGVGAAAVVVLSIIDLARRTVYLGVGGRLAAAAAVCAVLLATVVLRR